MLISKSIFRYGTGSDRRGTFFFHSSGFGCNIIIFGVYKSSSIHNDIHNDNSYRRKNFNFTMTRVRFCFKHALEWSKQLFIC